MTDTALNNPLVTAVMAVKSGENIVAVGTEANPMAATIVQGGTNILVGGKSVQKSASFARPADTTAYAANDAAYALSTTLLPYVCAAADTTIYRILTTLDAFTPASAQQFFLEITCELS